MASIGIIIITYNSGDEIGASLDAALATGSEIVVVDNASSDKTLDEVRARPSVRVIANSENRGFAAAANQGCAVLNNPYLLLLNPDSVILGDLMPLRAACDLPGSAGAGGRLVDRNGRMQTGFMARQLPTPVTLILELILLNRMWPGNPVNRRYRLIGRDYSTQFAVEQPAGAFLMIRRNVWQELGGMDEGFYPLWFEDVDFCKRIHDRGWLLYFVPQAVAKHTGGHSLPHLTLEKRRIYWYRSLLRFSSKTFGRGAHAAVCIAVVIGSLLRALGEAAIGRSFKPVGVYRKVIGLAVRSLFFAVRS